MVKTREEEDLVLRFVHVTFLTMIQVPSNAGWDCVDAGLRGMPPHILARPSHGPPQRRCQLTRLNDQDACLF